MSLKDGQRGINWEPWIDAQNLGEFTEPRWVRRTRVGPLSLYQSAEPGWVLQLWIPNSDN